MPTQGQQAVPIEEVQRVPVGAPLAVLGIQAHQEDAQDDERDVGARLEWREGMGDPGRVGDGGGPGWLGFVAGRNF